MRKWDWWRPLGLCPWPGSLQISAISSSCVKLCLLKSKCFFLFQLLELWYYVNSGWKSVNPLCFCVLYQTKLILPLQTKLTLLQSQWFFLYIYLTFYTLWWQHYSIVCKMHILVGTPLKVLARLAGSPVSTTNCYSSPPPSHLDPPAKCLPAQITIISKHNFGS